MEKYEYFCKKWRLLFIDNFIIYFTSIMMTTGTDALQIFTSCAVCVVRKLDRQ